MTGAGRELFGEYILEVLADCEKQEITLAAHIRELDARAAATDVRLSEIEEEVGELHDAITENLLVERKILSATKSQI